MNVALLMFYLLSSVLVGAAMMVVTVRNTVHGVLFLILAFFNAAGLFILAHAEFLAMILIIVYVGAVAVLFLFVVMMLDVERERFRVAAKRYVLMGSFVGGGLIAELLFMMITWHTSPEAFALTAAPGALYQDMPNTQALGNLLYTHYALVFQGVGIILFIAMIGAIVLTLRHREGEKKQNVREQLARHSKESVRLVDIPRGSGV